MNRVLIVGSGGVGRVVVHKCAQMSEIFSDICLVSRSLTRCKLLEKEVGRPLKTVEMDVDRVEDTVKLIDEFRPNVLINVASPYQNLPLMEACARTGVHYIDTSLLEDDKEEWSYQPQWNYDRVFKEKNITGILSLGFDPGVVNIYCAYARKHYFDEIESIDIADCNDGDHGLPFATNFDPETNIREILAPVFYVEDGQIKRAEPFSISRVFNFPGVGLRRAYLMAHEEVISLHKFMPEVKTIRFWMTFTDSYLQHLEILRNIGMTSMTPIEYEGIKIPPLRFLKALLPDPFTLGPRMKGKTSIVCFIKGKKAGKSRYIQIYNICDHQKAYAETNAQAIAYTAGVPAVLGAILILEGKWNQPGVYNPEQLDPDPFMERIGKFGLPWHVEEKEQVLKEEVIVG